MSDLRGLPAAASQEGSRPEDERLHRAAVPISLYEDGGKTVLATLKPTKLLAMFNVPELEQVAGEKLRCAFGWFVLAVAAFVLARNRPAFASIFSSEAP